MKKFLVTYHVPASAMAQMADSTPEQQAEGMKQWMDWSARVGDHMVDMGSPLMPGQQLTHGGHAEQSNKEFSGYSIIQADDMNQAKSLMDGHPHLNGWHPEATIELSETMQIPGM
jgi:hypothetical protein